MLCVLICALDVYTPAHDSLALCWLSPQCVDDLPVCILIFNSQITPLCSLASCSSRGLVWMMGVLEERSGATSGDDGPLW